MTQVVRPPIPYRSMIPGGIHEGKRIKLKGQVPYGANRFTVNLMTGLDSNSDRPFHISVRFDGNIVVRNTLQHNSYGTEERTGPFPFSFGRNFTMTLIVERAAYKISVNSQHCWDYGHRIPFSRVSSILIEGDVQIERIEYINAMRVQHPVTYFPPSAPVSVSPSAFNTPPLPCIFPIYGGIRPGMTIYISGRPTSNPQRCTINLQNGSATYPPPDVAFHFDVRFAKSYIVRNSRYNNVWASEETMISHFPFRPGVHFDMVIQVQSDGYTVNVNGQYFISFRHRQYTFSVVNTLYIENDVIVSSIRYT